MKNKECLNCDKELNGRQVKFCSRNCKGIYYYHNNEKVRQRKIRNASERVERLREMERVENERNLYKSLLEQVINEKTNEELDIEKLFNIINGK